MLPPLGIIFGLFVGFTAAQVWSDSDRASAAVEREASALRSVTILAAAFPGEPQSRLRALIGSYVAEATAQEWPLMARRAITLRIVPHALAEALQLNFWGWILLGPVNRRRNAKSRARCKTQWPLAASESLISRSEVSGVKWCCLYLQASCALIAIALVHSDNRLAVGHYVVSICNWRGRGGSADRSARPAFHRGDIGRT